MATIKSTETPIRIHKIGQGTMSMSVSGQIPDDQAFEVLRHALSQASDEEKVVINSSEHYGVAPHFTNNLQMLSRFFTKYPDLQQKAFLVVKGAMGIFPINASGERKRGCSPEALRASARGIAEACSPKCVDVFEPARIDKDVSIEETMKTLVALQREGFFQHIGLSECAALTLKRASSIAPISTVEVEISPMAWEEETQRVIETSAQVGAIILAYSPIGRGALAGTAWKDTPELLRLHSPRFQEETYHHNQRLTVQLGDMAVKKNVTTAQLSIAWVASLGAHLVPIPGSSKLARAEENFHAAAVDLSDKEREEITAKVASFSIEGDRYPGAFNQLNWG